MESKIEEKKELVVNPSLTGDEKKGECVTVEVGPVWSHVDFLARKDKGEFNDLLGSNWKMTGHWWTTVSGSMSVVQFAFHGDEKVTEEKVIEEKKTLVVSPEITGFELKGECATVEVGPIMSHKEFLQRNEKGEFKDILGPEWKMTGHWWMTVAGKMSVVQFTFIGEVQKPQETPKIVHQNIICDVCNKGAIVGTRFKCFQCPDYDLCEKCEPHNHRHHLMIRITEPQVMLNAMSGNNLVELDMHVPEQAMGLHRMHMRTECPFKKVCKPKVLEFKVVNINAKLSDSEGFVGATWDDVESNMQMAKDAVSKETWGIIKVEEGSFDGPGYMNRYRKQDTRAMGHKLIVKKENTEANTKPFRRCRNRLPHIIKKVSESLKQFNEKCQHSKEDKKVEEEQMKNSTAETQETKETEIIEEFDAPEEKLEDKQELVGEQVIEEKVEEENKPTLSSFIKDLNKHSAEGEIKNVTEVIKTTFEQPEAAQNLFKEMFSSGDKFGEAIKGFFDFVGNCNNNKEKVDQQCKEMNKQEEEPIIQEEEPIIQEEELLIQEEEPIIQEEELLIPENTAETNGVPELSGHDLEKAKYLMEMFPQYPEMLMKDLVFKHPTKSLSDLIDLIVAEAFY